MKDPDSVRLLNWKRPTDGIVSYLTDDCCISAYLPKSVEGCWGFSDGSLRGYQQAFVGYTGYTEDRDT